jgi:single-stranded-DNA-specific exonuclease
MIPLMTVYFPEIFEKLLEERGLTRENHQEFISPDYSKLHDPLLLPDMEKARDRIIEAIKNNEHIVVFSDYDADGIPGAVVLRDFFGRVGYENISFYIPHRHDEGFGLNLEAVEECSERGAKLIVTVDCGVADVKEISLANEKGMEVIITDHHEPGSTLPEAYAIVDPKRKDSIYPFKELCGSAVAYKLVQAILAKENFGLKSGLEKWSLDMVGIATLSDMVPLTGENRIFSYFGMNVLRKSPRPGLVTLLRKLKINQNYLTEDDITFMITPRINAASRMGSPEDAFNLLSTQDEREANVLADHLEKINSERKGIVASVVKDAKKHLLMRESLREVIVVGNPEWRPALLGLVANSLVEEYQRPVFVWGRDGNDILKGSCRSYNGYDLHSLMSCVGDKFIEFGGHSGAGGFSVSFESLTTLEENLSGALISLESSVSETKKERGLPINVSDIGEKLWQTISAFSPFGMDNAKPVFEIKGEIKSAKQFGKEKNHLEIVLGDGSKSVKAISFFSAPSSFHASLTVGSPVTLFANLEKSYFMNRPELRLRIVDILPQ